MENAEIQIFDKGVHNLLSDEIIPANASSDAKNWFTQDGRIKLVPGRISAGPEEPTGMVTGEIFGYRTDGTQVHWKKAGAKIQYSLDELTWHDCVPGLTVDDDYAFSNYSSLAGAFTFAFGVDGIFKMNNANPGSFVSLYDSAKNFKGRAFIDRGRTILWNRSEDKTGLYGSYIDPQNGTVYTTVTAEATTSGSGTLAFKAGGATRNAFGVSITVGSEVFRDDFNGNLKGSLGGTGTINYVTGVYTVSASGVGAADYQWEDSNNHSLTDFTHSATRLAGEGFQFPQDEGGDPIMQVLVGLDLAYYSIKQKSTYRLAIDSDDLGADNNVFRKELGLPSWRAATAIQTGIVFMNTSNPEKPELTILQKNPIGGDVEPDILFPHFKFANYDYADCTIDSYERYIIIACRSNGSSFNDVILLGNQEDNTVDITYYSARTFAKTAGKLYAGSPITTTIYSLYDGFDDQGIPIDNFYNTKAELFGTEELKKERKLRLKGLISPAQSYEVYISFDGAGFQLVGTVVGSGSYVDANSPQYIGGNIIGVLPIGGGSTTSSILAYRYFVEIRLKKVPKFRKRMLKFKAIGIGYVDIDFQMDWDIDAFEDRIPARFRQKQNVSIDGTQTDLPNPEF